MRSFAALLICGFAVSSLCACVPTQRGNEIAHSVLSNEFFLYPVAGAEETVFFVNPEQQDPVGAKFGLRHPVPGCKVEVLGDGPVSGSKQVKILEGALTRQEGWVFSDCLRTSKQKVPEAHVMPGHGNVAWSFFTNGTIESCPVINNNAVFFGSADRNLYALNSQNGSELWRYSTDSPIEGGITVAGGKIFFGAADGTFYCIRESDHVLLWINRSIQSFSSIYTKPLVCEDRVYFGNLKGEVKALDIKDGRLIWQFKANAEVNSSPIYANQTIYFGSRDDYMYALDAKTGLPMWKMNISGTINDAPILEGDNLYFFARHYSPTAGTLYCVNARTGFRKWSKTIQNETFGEFKPTIKGNMIFATSTGQYNKRNNHYLYSVSKSDGRILWKRLIPTARTPLTIYEDLLVYGGINGVYMLNSKNGALRHVEACGETRNSAPITSRDIVYLGSLDKHFYAIRIPKTHSDLPVASQFPLVKESESSFDGSEDTPEESEPLITRSGIDTAIPRGIEPNLQLPSYGKLRPSTSSHQTDSNASNLKQHELELLQKSEETVQKQQQEIQQLKESKFADSETIRSLKEQLLNLGERVRTLGTIKPRGKGENPQPPEVAEELNQFETRWPNVQNFLPGEYKRDVFRRLNRDNAGKPNNPRLMGEWKITFTIQKDGSPTNILLVTPGADVITQKECCLFVEAAAPFRPLLPPSLDKLNVEVTTGLIDDRTTAKFLEIEALGNRI